MSYSTTPITSISDIPSLVKSFADTLGFTTSTVSATQVTVKHPSYTLAKTFTVKVNNEGSGLTLRQRIEVSCDVVGSIPAWAESPKLNKTQVDTDAAVTVEAPTKLHLFGARLGGSGDPGKSFIAGVIEYGYNLYRHFYLGYVDKITSFDNGELITGSSVYPFADNITSGNFTVAYDHKANVLYSPAYPFQATVPDNTTSYRNGGCYIPHAANAESWREFNLRSSWSSAGFDAATSVNGHKVVLGGFGDSINSGYMNAAKSPFQGVNILVPINLYIGKRVSSQQYLQAIGSVSGARMVHMEDLEPGAEVTIGTSVWRVFPVFSKSSDPYNRRPVFLGTNRRFPQNNSSYFVGMAYLVSE